ncbi:oxysterol-binding protein-related protein 1-like [Tropilaelaps mercedesae]|uniref:Oxysterol-binding protein-related protein 1-like n=1 Tax=Tropilaelaps mercedesae TaxID=418985 RepID=A0A1V9XW54_9ACAR|nr:oxysterol-binding protein-related protein 1-like [Tropilaelaps mercedesae]
MITEAEGDCVGVDAADENVAFSDAVDFDTAESDEGCSDAEEELLQAARTGDAERIQKLFEQHCSLNIDCKGRHKWNLQWTPLHLAAYFGHLEAARLLLQKGASSSIPNGEGDTPLHKAALTGREPLLMLLLAHGADVLAVNAEGNSAYDVASELYLKNVLTAAELADKKRKEEAFFQAVKDGDVAAIHKLLKSGNKRPVSSSNDHDLTSISSPRIRRRRLSRTNVPDVNCVDAMGNTALHAAAHRDLRAVAVLLLQCGANPNLRNRRGLTAADLARSEQMAGILQVAPIQEIKKCVARFEGPVMRKRRFLGTQAVWAVVDRGVLAFFRNRADASSGSRRKRFHYLEGAVVLADPRDERCFTVVSANGTSERLSTATALDKSRWLRALKEHATFGPKRSEGGDPNEQGFIDINDQILLLGCVQDALMTAQAQQALLASEVSEAARMHTSFLATSLKEGEFSVRAQNASHLLRAQLAQVSESGRNALSCLETCLLLMKQHEEARAALLAREVEKNRILRETLAAFAEGTFDSESLLLDGHQSQSPEASPETDKSMDPTSQPTILRKGTDT